MIVRMGIRRAVIGTEDPNPLVAGSGIRRLTEAGVEVIRGILKDDCIALNRRFFMFQQRKRPYVILKWAESADGFIAPAKQTGGPHWVSNSLSRQLVHRWRSEEAGILIGANTAIEDNPQLTVRDWSGQNPVRVIIARRPLPGNLNVFDRRVKTIVITEKKISRNDENLIFEVADFSRPIVPQILNALYEHGIQSVIVEGGLRTLQSFIDAGLWDEARVFVGQTVLGSGIPAPRITCAPIKRTDVNGDALLIFRK
jgi:diaminohydroxyphosphoribosylaminopyrimidine deaminase/5-amino-6-(5-phosphoribosylamino)uracil reductase